MTQFSFKYRGLPLYENPDWVGFVFKASGVGLLSKWFLRNLTKLDEFSDSEIIICDLNGNNESEILETTTQSNVKPFALQRHFDDKKWNNYITNYGGDHFITSSSNNWRLILPFDEQTDDWSYGIWAGEKSTWEKLKPILEQIPKKRDMTAELHNEKCTNERSDFFFSDRPELPRNIALSLRHAKFVDE